MWAWLEQPIFRSGGSAGKTDTAKMSRVVVGAGRCVGMAGTAAWRAAWIVLASTQPTPCWRPVPRLPIPNFPSRFNSFHPDTRKPMHRECGFIRLKPDTNKVAFVSAQNTGEAQPVGWGCWPWEATACILSRGAGTPIGNPAETCAGGDHGDGPE